jgi:hypothetical protein
VAFNRVDFTTGFGGIGNVIHVFGSGE